MDYPVPGKLPMLDSLGGEQSFNTESYKQMHKGIKFYEGK